MTLSTHKPKDSINKHTNKFLYSALISMAVLAATNPTMGYAAEAEKKAEKKATEVDADKMLEEVIVTGIRGSIMSSIAKKRNSSSIVEAISSEDFGKLPDASIGEALSRLPGLASQRFDGRANKISIRGLAPDFTSTTLNGREMVSSDNNRSVEYDQFPSELITGATVYKTPDATLTSQAVGGTVDMQTVRPLNYKEPVFVVGMRGEVSDKGALNAGTSAWGYRGNVAYIGQNEEGTVGYAFGYSRMVQPIQEQYVHYWGYSPTGPSNDQLIDGVKPFVKSNKLTRDGFLAVLELEPNDKWHSRLDGFYSKFKDGQTLRGMEVAGYTKSGFQSLAVENNLITQGVLNGVKTQNRNDFSDRDISTYALGWNTLYQANDDLGVELDVSYSKAKRTYAANEIYFGSGRGGSGLTDDIGFSLVGENGITLSPTRTNYADPNIMKLGDNLGWGGPFCTAALGWQCDSQDGFRNTETSSDDMAAIKLAAERQLEGPISSIKVGARYSERNKHHTRKGEFLTLKDYPNTLRVPDKYLLAPTSLDFIGMGNLLSFNSRALFADGFYNLADADLLGAAVSTWSVKEKVLNAYVMANIDTEMGDTAVTGNVGIQVVHTDQQSAGVKAHIVNGVIESLDALEGDKYWTILPSLNLSFDVAEDQKIRIGAARVMARPRMDQMNSSFSINYIDANVLSTDLAKSPWGGGGGNPKLRPWMSWQFDLAYEAYFGDGGYVSIAGFYKHLENYVYTKKVLADFTGITAPGIIEPILREGYIDAPANGDGGKIYGVELSASLPFSMMSENLEGFGALMSASFTNSSVKEAPTDKPVQLPGLSKTVVNGTLYYEKSGFQARVSVRYRSAYLAESFAIGLSREEKMAKSETIFDAQLSYDLSNIGVEGMSLYLQGSNLTNAPFTQYYADNVRKTHNSHTYGRNVMFGFTYKM